MLKPDKNATESRRYTKISVAFRASVAIILLTAFSACSSESDVNIPEQFAALDNLIIIQPDETAYTLYLEENLYLNQLKEKHTHGLWALYADKDRNIYWADHHISKIHQYSPDGTHLRSFGQRGQGPGEFDHMSWSAVHNNRLYVLEYGPQKVHTFYIETGQFVESFVLDQPPFESVLSRSSKLQILNDTTMLGIPNFIMGPRGLNDDSLTVFLYETDGTLIDPEFFRIRKPGALEGTRGGGRFSSGGRFTAKSELVVLPGDAGFVYSHASEPLFTFYNSAGDYQKAIYLNVDPVPLTQAHINYEIENSNPMVDLESAFQHASSIPETWPFWDNFFVSDDGNLWVSVFTEPPYGQELWVISPEGSLLARKTLENQHAIRFVDSDYLYTTNRPDGIFEIRRYQISFQDK